MFSLRNRRSLTILELLIAVSIILILIGTFAIYANTTLKIAREVALQNELSNIRMSIEYYRMVNSRYPDSFSNLINQRLTGGGYGSKIFFNQFLIHTRVDQEGNLLDPFLHKYGYNKLKGTVYSQTKGYERW